jgi:hypothetical protein
MAWQHKKDAETNYGSNKGPLRIDHHSHLALLFFRSGGIQGQEKGSIQFGTSTFDQTFRRLYASSCPTAHPGAQNETRQLCRKCLPLLPES